MDNTVQPTLSIPMPNIARVTLFIMFVHLSLGAIMPYLPVWLGETKGLSGAQIGLILASSSFGRIVIGPLAAAWAEGRRDRRLPLLVFAMCVALGYAAYPFAGPFWPIAALCFATGVAGQCLVAFAEATTLRATTGSTFWPYGRARAMASTAFALASLGAGAAVQAFGVGAAYVWFIAATSGTFLCCFWLDRDPILGAVAKPISGRLLDGLTLFLKPSLFIGVLAAGFIQAAHAFYYGFSSTLWLAQGFTGTQVGLLWALGVGVEVLFLAFVVSKLSWIKPEAMILIGGIGAVLRWASMSFGFGLGVSCVIQVLHALTFATTHIGFMRLVENELGPDQRATGQQLSSSLIMSPLMGIASIGAGWLFDHYRMGGYWSGVGLATVGCVLVGTAMIVSQARTRIAQN
jgi:MFS transporter, PPP family, 3-phenylpropionic acid transporter